jgi:hypothetical protein
VLERVQVLAQDQFKYQDGGIARRSFFQLGASRHVIASAPLQGISILVISLQRHFSVLTKFAHVESRLSGRKRQKEVMFYAPVNICNSRAAIPGER